MLNANIRLALKKQGKLTLLAIKPNLHDRQQAWVDSFATLVTFTLLRVSHWLLDLAKTFPSSQFLNRCFSIQQFSATRSHCFLCTELLVSPPNDKLLKLHPAIGNCSALVFPKSQHLLSVNSESIWLRNSFYNF